MKTLKPSILLIATILMLVLSVLLSQNGDQSFVFGFPFAWLTFFHLGRSIEVFDLFKLSKYLIRIDFLLIDLLLSMLAVQSIFKLFSRLKRKPGADGQT